MIRFQVTALTFSGGETIPLEANSLMLLVGPNSSGKSRALVDTERFLHKPAHEEQLVVTSASTDVDGDNNAFQRWLSKHYPKKLRGAESFYLTKGHAVPEKVFAADWKDQIQKVCAFLAHRMNTEDRLQIAKPKGRINPTSNPSEYIHVLQMDTDLLQHVSNQVRQSFDKDLIINWGGGNNIWFHVGDEPERDAEKDRVSSKYLNELDRVPRLEQEGDGIKSYVGCLLGVMCGAHKVLMVDEPEAFLHPSQARRLGRLLADSAAARERQIIASTHSPDIVVGALASGRSVSVCRLDRDDDANHAYVLDSGQLAELWSKPLLQSTGAINGIFHKGIVVCEADADCRFFEAVLARMEKKGKFRETPDLYFIHGGGKGSIETLVSAYCSLSVTTAAVADFDVMRRREEFAGMLRSFGIDFEDVASDYSSAVSALNDLPPTKSIEDFGRRGTALINDAVAEGSLSGSVKHELLELLEQSAPWSEAKKYGIGKLKGGAYTACRNVIQRCVENGFFIIKTGELESFWREGPASKNEWIVRAIDKVSSDPDSFVEAEEFLSGICAYFGYLSKQ